MIKLLILTLWVIFKVEGILTIEVPDLQYLADHLQPDECKKLVTSLHFRPDVESKVTENTPCLRLLLNWNSAEGGRNVEAHEMLFRKLRQIDRSDLAVWLRNTVFHQLGEELNRPIEQPLEHNSKNIKKKCLPLTEEPLENKQKTLDAILWSLIIMLILIIVIIMSRSLLLYFQQKATLQETNSCRKECRGNRRRYGRYDEYEVRAIISDTESEGKSNTKKKKYNDPAFKLMGVK